MEPLEELASCGFYATKSDELRLQVHSMFVSYVANLSEVEKLRSLKRGASRTLPFQRCLVDEQHLAELLCRAPRTMCGTVKLMEKMTYTPRNHIS